MKLKRNNFFEGFPTSRIMTFNPGRYFAANNSLVASALHITCLHASFSSVYCSGYIKNISSLSFSSTDMPDWI